MNRPLSGFEQATVLIVAYILGALIGFAYASTCGITDPVRHAAAPPHCLPLEACP